MTRNAPHFVGFKMTNFHARRQVDSQGEIGFNQVALIASVPTIVRGLGNRRTGPMGPYMLHGLINQYH